MTKTIIIGLTGSIGTGKSTTAKLFAEESSAATIDADAQVHTLYAPNGAAVAPVAAKYPQVIANGGISRPLLSQLILTTPSVLADIEAIVHPLVRQEQLSFVQRAAQDGREFALLDVPLLFEAGTDKNVDAVVVTTCPAELQRERVLKREGMDEQKFEKLLAKQMPSSEKVKRADYVVRTSSLEEARGDVKKAIADLRGKVELGELTPMLERMSGKM